MDELQKLKTNTDKRSKKPETGKREREEEPEINVRRSSRLAKIQKINQLKSSDCELLKLIEYQKVSNPENVGWDDIAGLIEVKEIIKEAVVYPMIRPDLFDGLRSPPTGTLFSDESNFFITLQSRLSLCFTLSVLGRYLM